MKVKHLKLTKYETTVLAKGLNFTVAPERIPHDEFIVVTELATIELIKQHPNKDPRAADELRSEVVDILSKSHPQKQNLSKDQRKQISSLAKRKDLLVLPDTQEYKDKIKVILADERVYKKLKCDPTREYKGKLVALFTGLKDQGKISMD